MSKDIKKKLKSRWDSFTTAEQKIASHLLQNIDSIPFETAASLGKKVDVSPMTVGRFLRNLGYAGLAELKEELRGGAPWLQLYSSPGGAQAASPSEALQSEIRGLTAVHALTTTREWTAIVDLLVQADRVSVTSFHHGRFLGMGLASLLQHVKPRTSFADGLDGAYADVLLDSTEQSCVVLIDFRRYSRHFRLLAEEVAQRGIPLVIITDTPCYWARQLTDHVLMLPIDDHRAWHNFSAANSLFSLLIGAVSNEMGDRFERIGDTTQLRQKFVGYVEAPAAGERPPSKPTAKKAGGTTRKRRPSPKG
ncbi:RpiR family transcriptional regulator [Luteibacter rhizovicinus DSM 16549]|uniref:RpiR family transcriptional regulator n=1 Tax=Luteibacter rhizovicinus DSM 16549 TaxID=1440763 RepID=A0A1L3EXW4_9GAMM|nr:MurR/RpiR family transcriptional regulator [Luteibacter rhizovicinus]APG05850.1 RpiR family transcriptional regulator [Luteibacter rhizovicinus DSM 16549]